MSYSVLDLHLVGTTPLLMANGRLADPLDPIARSLRQLTSKRHKTEADYEEIARREYLGSLWIDDAGQPCIPSTAIEACFLKAALRRRLGHAARFGLICLADATLLYDGPRDVEELCKNPSFRLRALVRRNRQSIMRTRPYFPTWGAVVTVQFLQSLLNEREVIEVMELAGEQAGLGDWRSRFGHFRLVHETPRNPSPPEFEQSRPRRE